MRVLVAILALSSSAALAPAQSGSKTPADPIRQLGQWVERFDETDAEIATQDLAWLTTLVADVRMSNVVEPERRCEAFLTLLDLASFEPRASERGEWRPNFPISPRQQASRMGFEALERALDVDRGERIAPWMANTLLVQTPAQPVQRRRAALELLRERREPATLLAVLGCAVAREREVRDAAMAALEGWDHELVHRLMLEQLDRSQSVRGWISNAVVLRHFERIELAPPSPIRGLVREHAWRDLASPDWRVAVTGVRLMAVLDGAAAVPPLIELLSVWIGRRELGAGSRRVEDEILRNLKKRSGRSLGPHPERWSTWWKCVQAGTTPANADDDPNATRSGFFGLRAWTDRVVFVIDNSGSMGATFGSTGATRYDAALQQMTSLMRQLGAATRFRVVLFESEPHVWKDSLQLATPVNLEAAHHWCAYNAPGGGTGLRAAIEHVLRLDRKGEPDLRRIEEDTVIVLCDGETAEGPQWVRPLLERVNQDAGLIFHCVQIGSQGDGALLRLAEVSGGDFVHIED